ncbi:MAG: stage III sporulation protein AF [Bacillota bacterium]
METLISLLQEIVRNIVLIVILACFMELLAAKGEMAKYIRLVMGLFIIVAVLQPVLKIFHTGFALESISLSSIRGDNEIHSILTRADRLSQQHQNLVAEELKEKTEQQIEAVTSLVAGVKEAEARVEFAAAKADFLDISFVEIIVQLDHREGDPVQSIPQVRRVQVTLNEHEYRPFPLNEEEQFTASGNEAVSQKITQVISDFFGIQRERIRVTIGTAR